MVFAGFCSTLFTHDVKTSICACEYYKKHPIDTINTNRESGGANIVILILNWAFELGAKCTYCACLRNSNI